MKKLIAELLILTMSAGLLAGCGAQSSTTVIPTAADATAETATAQSATGQMQGGQPGGNAGGMIDKSSDTELQSILAEVEDQFRQETYTDSQTGLSVAYNIYLPADYDASKTYPMVVFIPDSSTVGKDATAALEQGYGGVIWATQEEQAKHEAIVVAVEYPDVVLDDHNGYVTTDYVDLTPRLIQSITEKYSVDDNRIYGTGQSMGCMTMMIIAAQNPDLFAACMFVDGQWDASTLKDLAGQKFFCFAAEGDDKAYEGMQELIPVLEDAGASVSTAQYDATWSDEELTAAVEKEFAEGNDINCVTWKKGTVLPAGTAEGTSEHMYSFDYAYRTEAVRDWLFAQTKQS